MGTTLHIGRLSLPRSPSSFDTEVPATGGTQHRVFPHHFSFFCINVILFLIYNYSTQLATLYNYVQHKLSLLRQVIPLCSERDCNKRCSLIKYYRNMLYSFFFLNVNYILTSKNHVFTIVQKPFVIFM